jgi:hypothetical protein
MLFASLAVVLFTGLFASIANAQGVDSSLTGIGPRTLCKPANRDSTRAPGVPRVVIAGQVERVLPECRVPISPRAALIRSLLIPGSAQFQLNRPKAATLFVAAELSGIAMAVKSKSDLDKATAARRDTTIVGVVDANGAPVIDPKTGLQKTVGQPRNQNLADRVRARRTHLEDWIAGVVFNHLFSGADAWVAANLADFNANVDVTAVDGGRGVRIAAYVLW